MNISACAVHLLVMCSPRLYNLSMNYNCGIYLISVDRSVDGKGHKFYVGKSIELRRRIRDHKKALRDGTHRNVLLKRAWDKYGEDAFTFTVILLCSPNEAIGKEQAALDEIRASLGDDALFNILKDCIETRLGVKHSDETRMILSERQAENWKDQGYRVALSASLRAAQRRPDVRARNSAAQKEAQTRPDVVERKRQAAIAVGSTASFKARRAETDARPEVKARRGAAMRAALSTPEVKRRISEKQKVIQNDPELKARIAATRSTPEARARRIEAGIRCHGTPEAREKQRQIQLIAQKNPETNKKRSESLRAFHAYRRDKLAREGS